MFSLWSDVGGPDPHLEIDLGQPQFYSGSMEAVEIFWQSDSVFGCCCAGAGLFVLQEKAFGSQKE